MMLCLASCTVWATSFKASLGIPSSHDNGDVPSEPEENPTVQFHTQITLIFVGRFHPAGVPSCVVVYKFKGIVHADMYYI